MSKQPETNKRLGEGDTLPDFELATPDGGMVRAADLRGKPLVLFFYPKDDTPGCTTENKDFSALADQFAAASVALLGVSKDTPAKHAKFIARHALAAPLASDAETEQAITRVRQVLNMGGFLMYGRSPRMEISHCGTTICGVALLKAWPVPKPAARVLCFIGTRSRHRAARGPPNRYFASTALG